jgi:DNA-binding SARP family transcriptional activator
MEIRLLGPVELVSARGPVPIGSEKQRALLAFLALRPQRLVTNDALVDGLWGDDPPDGAVKALRFHVSRLRGILRQADAADTLQTRPGGYLLAVAEDAVDVVRFERAVAGARLARSDGAAPDAVSSAFRDALALWAGPALADINGEPFVAGERRRLEELRLVATEDYIAAELAGGRHAEAVGELERMVDGHPLRERLWELLITALYRSGRQGDALAAYQRVRRILADELGIEPSAPLRELEQKVLLQDADLAAPATNPRAVSGSNGESVTPADVEPPPAEWNVRPSPGLARSARPGRRLAAWRVAAGIIAVAVAILVSVLFLYQHVDGDTADADTATSTTVPRETDDGDTATSTTVPRERPPGRIIPLEMLEVGDCYNLPQGIDRQVQSGGVSSENAVLTVWLVACEQPHEQEVFHLFELAAGPYPGEAEMQAFAREQCTARFAEYVGVSPERSGLHFVYVWPSRTSWGQWLRKGGCALFDPVGRDLTGSMAGTRR